VKKDLNEKLLKRIGSKSTEKMRKYLLIRDKGARIKTHEKEKRASVKGVSLNLASKLALKCGL
jgi:hypothetical protein